MLKTVRIFFEELYLSTHSKAFYCKIFKDHKKGYGIKHMLIGVFFISIVLGVATVNIIYDVKQYLHNSISSKNSLALEEILNKLPEIYYNGKHLEIKQTTSINNKLLISHKYSEKYLYVLTDKYFIFNMNGVPLLKILIPEILGKEPIKTSLNKMLEIRTYIYIIFPITIAIYFLVTLISQQFFIIILFLVGYAMSIKMQYTQASRLIIYANMPSMILKSLLPIFFTQDYNFVIALKIWCLYIMAYSVIAQREKG